MSAVPRLNRLFGADGKCFVLAMDHGFYNVDAFLSGLEEMKPLVERLAKAGPDAMLLAVGQACLLQDIPGRRKPGLVLRTDTSNAYASGPPQVLFSQLIGDPVEQALALDAACVVVNLICPSDRGDVHHRCVANVCAVRAASARCGMPMMVEPVALKLNDKKDAYAVDSSLERILPLVRQAVELGADVLKVPACEDISQYHEVVETASGRPVLILGGSPLAEKELFARTKVLLGQGASGIVYGRNVFQHPRPDRMAGALMAMVHDGADAKKASAILAGK